MDEENSFHFLKIKSEFYAAVISGEKRFEVRKDDRDPRFAVGDILILEKSMQTVKKRARLRSFRSITYTGRNFACPITVLCLSPYNAK